MYQAEGQLDNRMATAFRLPPLTRSPVYRPPVSSTTSTVSKCCTDNTITVTGTATIQAQPDIAVLNAQLTAQADTVK